MIKDYDLSKKVIITGEISQSEKFKLYSKSLGAVFIPFKEDYGRDSCKLLHLKNQPFRLMTLVESWN